MLLTNFRAVSGGSPSPVVETTKTTGLCSFSKLYCKCERNRWDKSIASERERKPPTWLRLCEFTRWPGADITFSDRDNWLLFYYRIAVNNAKSSKLCNVLGSLRNFPNYGRFSAHLGQDASRDLIATCIRPEPSSTHVRWTRVRLKGLIYRQTSRRKTVRDIFERPQFRQFG